jgi:hypothetical protein
MIQNLSPCQGLTLPVKAVRHIQTWTEAQTSSAPGSVANVPGGHREQEDAPAGPHPLFAQSPLLAASRIAP